MFFNNFIFIIILKHKKVRTSVDRGPTAAETGVEDDAVLEVKGKRKAHDMLQAGTSLYPRMKKSLKKEAQGMKASFDTLEIALSLGQVHGRWRKAIVWFLNQRGAWRWAASPPRAARSHSLVRSKPTSLSATGAVRSE